MFGGSRRAPLLAFVVATALALASSSALAPTRARADDVAEAGALFTSGNQHLQAATRLRGERRTRELEAALADYVASLRIVRSRNVLFNASLALEMLERHDDAFNYLAEYLAVPGLSEAERTEATRRVDALRPRVAVLALASEPAGAEVWIDRRDLSARGRTPLEYALPAGEHRLWLRLDGYLETEARATVVTGQTARATVALQPAPVSLQVLAPAEPRLTLDGEPIVAGAHVEIAPGDHVVRLEAEGLAPIERRFEVLPGAAPMVIDLAPALAGTRRAGATLVVASRPAARVMVDGLLVGGGERVEAPILAGEHDVRVEADGHVPFATRRAFAVGDRAELRVELVERRGNPLLAPRIVVGVLTGLSTIGVATTAVGWAFADGAWDGCDPSFDECADEADLVESWGIAAYTLWGIAGAMAITEIALLIADGGGDERSSGEFVLAPVPTEGGLMLVGGGRL